MDIIYHIYWLLEPRVAKSMYLYFFFSRVLNMPTQKWPDFDANGLPEAENLRIRSFFRDLSFGGGLDPKIEVS